MLHHDSFFLLLISIIVVFLYSKYEQKVNSLFDTKKIRIRDAVFMVILMGVMITIIAFIPQVALMILVLFANSLLLGLFSYVIAPKWYFALLTPILFIALYVFYWNIHLLNIFAILFALSISFFLGSIFSWKSTAAFVAPYISFGSNGWFSSAGVYLKSPYVDDVEI